MIFFSAGDLRTMEVHSLVCTDCALGRLLRSPVQKPMHDSSWELVVCGLSHELLNYKAWVGLDYFFPTQKG